MPWISLPKFSCFPSLLKDFWRCSFVATRWGNSQYKERRKLLCGWFSKIQTFFSRETYFPSYFFLANGPDYHWCVRMPHKSPHRHFLISKTFSAVEALSIRLFRHFLAFLISHTLKRYPSVVSVLPRYRLISSLVFFLTLCMLSFEFVSMWCIDIEFWLFAAKLLMYFCTFVSVVYDYRVDMQHINHSTRLHFQHAQLLFPVIEGR